MLHLKQRRVANGNRIHGFRHSDRSHEMRRDLHNCDFPVRRGFCPHLRVYVYRLCVAYHRRRQQPAQNQCCFTDAHVPPLVHAVPSTRPSPYVFVWLGIFLPLSSRTLNSSRSEEHTSEPQSPDHLVCRLLLEKKNHLISKLTSV